METRTKVPSRSQGRGWVYLTLILWTLSRLDATLAGTSSRRTCSHKPLTLNAKDLRQQIPQFDLTGSSTCKWLITNDNYLIYVSSAVSFKLGCKNDAVQVYDGKDSRGSILIGQKCPWIFDDSTIGISSKFVYVEVNSLGGIAQLNITYWATSGVPPVTRCSIGVMAGVILGLMLRF